MPVCLGLDTSNYTTSVAVFDGATGKNCGKLLEVPEGTLGLRQSDALFQHVKRLPGLFAALREEGVLEDIAAVGASTRPRAVESSYMPCFLPGETVGRCLADVLGVPFFPCAHQEGHIAAAAWSAGRLDLLDSPLLAWHLSGGTTELLHVIPAGKALDALAQGEAGKEKFTVKVNDLTFSFSGMENKVKAMAEQGKPPGEIARFALDTVAGVVRRVTAEAQNRWPDLPVLCSGGVASNTRLRYVLTELCQAIFAAPEFSADNAMGVAILTHRMLKEGSA